MIANIYNSSSFLIPINALNEIQIQKLVDFKSEWNIEIKSDCVFGYSFFDEKIGDISYFLIGILNIDRKYIYWWDTIDNFNDLDLENINREILQDGRKNKLIHIKDIN